MPLSHRVLEDGLLVVSDASGDLGDDELLDYMQRLDADESIRPTARSLVDFSSLDSCEVGSETVRAAARIAEEWYTPAKSYRVAVVAPSDVAYGLARMYATLADGNASAVRTFRTREDALRWLEIEEPPERAAS